MKTIVIFISIFVNNMFIIECTSDVQNKEILKGLKVGADLLNEVLS